MADDDDGAPGAVDTAVPARPAIGGDERRMHVRAYNHWVSLLAGHPLPTIARLEPENIADFGAHSVLLDFTGGDADPGIAYLGRALRDECGIDRPVQRISDVPGRSLLSRLTDHYRQIIANRAPVGFEAEFVGTRGHTMMYRGILMPFSSDGAAIDYIYGVINWKELVGDAAQARLDAEVSAALKAAPAPTAPVRAWADGPGAGDGDPAGPLEHRAALATVRLPVTAPDGYVLLLGRVAGDTVEIVADVTAPEPLAEAIRRAA